VTRAVERAAELASRCGDHTALLEVTAAGLRMSPGDEQFLSLCERAAVNCRARQ
jgi:hypothetical protein